MNARLVLLAWMAAMAAGSVLAAGVPREPATASADKSPTRSLTAIQRDVYAALREEAVSRREGPNAAEVIRLVELYREMAAHPKRDESKFLAELGLKVRARLRDVCQHIERKHARAGRPAKNQADAPADVIPETHVLGQQLGPGGGVPGQGLGGQPAGGRPAAGQAFDYGPELADIIRSVISPSTWDINGGRGAVVYYAPLRVLVVSAPDEVHPQIGNLLGQMRAAP
jgi:hypothetical protein